MWIPVGRWFTFVYFHSEYLFGRLKKWFTFVYIFRISTCSAGWRGDAHFVLWNASNACNSFLLPPFEGTELFSERKLKNNRQIDLGPRKLSWNLLPVRFVKDTISLFVRCRVKLFFVWVKHEFLGMKKCCWAVKPT